MVEDGEIKTTVSPFAIRSGEDKVFDGNEKQFVSMDYIVRKINMGQIGEVHFKIIELINEFEFMTSRQIFQMLNYLNVDIASQDKLNNKLEQLIKLKILTRYYFASEEGKCIYKVYGLEKMGKYVLNSKEIQCRWQPTDSLKPVSAIKKRLAGNQVLIAYIRKVKAFDSYRVNVNLKTKKTKKYFKATGGLIKLTKSNKSIEFLFEVVRREEEWEKKLEDKMKLYKEFYDSFSEQDCGFEKMPQLIFICEDDKHMVETFKEIVKNQLELRDIQLFFTTDLKQMNENLSKSLVEFKLDEDTKKYKIVECGIKVLE